jgi:hypothetical protein
MVTAVVSLVVIAVGIPLLLVWLHRRRTWDRVRGRPREDLWGDWMRRHRLTGGEAGDISGGVTRGREFSDPRLRAAAADWAGIVLRTETPSRKTLICLAVVAVLAVVAGLVFRAKTGRPVDIDWFSIAVWVLIGAWVRRRRRGLRRAIEVNGGASARR